MPRTTISEACRKRGIDRKEWDEARRQGIDPWDRNAWDEWKSKRRHRIKPGTELPPDENGGTPQSVEDIEDALRKSRSIDEVKILKEKLAALKLAIQYKTETRELVPVGEVRQSATRVYSAVRGELLKLSSDLPPRLAGLNEAPMQSLIRAAILEILTRLSDETAKLYAEES